MAFQAFIEPNPFLDAASKGKLSAVKQCVEDGADVNFTNRSQTALHRSAALGHLPIVKYLVKHPYSNVNLLDNDNRTAFEYALIRGHFEIAKCLLSCGKIDLSKTTKYEANFLFMAAKEGYLFVVEFLLNHTNIDVTLKDRYGHTAQWYALRKENLVVARLIFEKEIAQILVEMGNVK